MATVGNVLEAFAYYVGNGGYYEKKSGDAQYLTRALDNFAANKGDANYTYMGKLCGVNPGAWCAMMVSTAVYEGCSSDRAAAKEALWGVWPYTVCSSLWNAAPAAAKHYSWYQRNAKGKTGAAYTPRVGDVIEFSDDTNGFSHTGMVYAVDSSYVYTYEGNSANMARKRSYSLRSSYIYGYVTLNLDGADLSGIAQFQSWLGVTADGIYGPVTKKAAIRAHQRYLNAAYGAQLAADGEWGPMTYYATHSLQVGDDNDDVTVWQGLLYCAGYDPIGLDGSFGRNTEAATADFQSGAGLNPIGIADRYTWAKMFGQGRPAHTILRQGSTGAEVKYLQRLLVDKGWTLETDGVFGPRTEQAVQEFQAEHDLEVDGIVGPATWEALE